MDPGKKKLAIIGGIAAAVAIVVAVILVLVFVVFKDDTPESSANTANTGNTGNAGKTGSSRPTPASAPASSRSAPSDMGLTPEVGQSITLTDTRKDTVGEMLPTGPVTVEQPIEIAGSSIGVVRTEPVQQVTVKEAPKPVIKMHISTDSGQIPVYQEGSIMWFTKPNGTVHKFGSNDDLNKIKQVVLDAYSKPKPAPAPIAAPVPVLKMHIATDSGQIPVYQEGSIMWFTKPNGTVHKFGSNDSLSTIKQVVLDAYSKPKPLPAPVVVAPKPVLKMHIATDSGQIPVYQEGSILWFTRPNGDIQKFGSNDDLNKIKQIVLDTYSKPKPVVVPVPVAVPKPVLKMHIATDSGQIPVYEEGSILWFTRPNGTVQKFGSNDSLSTIKQVVLDAYSKPKPLPVPVTVAPKPAPVPVTVAPKPAPVPVTVAPKPAPVPVTVAPKPAPVPVCDITDIVSAKVFYDRANANKAIFAQDKTSQAKYISGDASKKICSISFNNVNIKDGKKSYIAKRFTYKLDKGRWVPVDYN